MTASPRRYRQDVTRRTQRRQQLQHRLSTHGEWSADPADSVHQHGRWGPAGTKGPPRGEPFVEHYRPGQAGSAVGLDLRGRDQHEVGRRRRIAPGPRLELG